MKRGEKGEADGFFKDTELSCTIASTLAFTRKMIIMCLFLNSDISGIMF